MKDKQSLRIWAKEIRKNINMTHISVILADKLQKNNDYIKSKNIMLYYPIENEVNLLSLLNDSSKQFYLPRINKSGLECCPYSLYDELSESCFHTKEPVCNSCNKTIIDLVVVPALACDKQGYRLGYGGGFYDRFLKDFSGIKIACIPKELIFDSIYPEKHDIKMDLVIHS